MFKKTRWLFLILVIGCGSGQPKDTPPEERSQFEQTVDAFDGGEVMPRKYKTIYIHHFSNKSYQGDVISRLKEKLQTKFNLDGRLKVENDKKKADAWLYGTVGIYNKAPASYDRFNKATRYLMTMVVSIRMRPNTKHSDELMLDRKEIRADTSFSPRVAPFETEFVATERLLEKMSDRIVYTSFEGWYSEKKSDWEKGYHRDKEAKEEQAKTRKQPDQSNILNRLEAPKFKKK